MRSAANFGARIKLPRAGSAPASIGGAAELDSHGPMRSTTWAVQTQPVSVATSATVRNPTFSSKSTSYRSQKAATLAARVRLGLPPHTTTYGVARIRIGKDSKPLTGSTLAQLRVIRGGRNVTADLVPGVRFANLDQAQVRRLRQTIITGAERRNLAGLGDRELLEAFGLILCPDVTLAAVLLVGNRSTLAKYAPKHELTLTRRQDATRYDVCRNLRGPPHEVLDEVQRLLDANLRVSTADISGFRQAELPVISWWVAREAVLNALVHRDDFLPPVDPPDSPQRPGGGHEPQGIHR